MRIFFVALVVTFLALAGCEWLGGPTAPNEGEGQEDPLPDPPCPEATFKPSSFEGGADSMAQHESAVHKNFFLKTAWGQKLLAVEVFFANSQFANWSYDLALESNSGGSYKEIFDTRVSHGPDTPQKGTWVPLLIPEDIGTKAADATTLLVKLTTKGKVGLGYQKGDLGKWQPMIRFRLGGYVLGPCSK